MSEKVIVIGAGVVGLSAACALAERGCDVTVLERYGLAHECSASRGPSKAIRHEYGAASHYSQMVARSLALWQQLARESGRSLYTQTGVLTLGRETDPHTLPGLETMRSLGLPAERLSRDQCRARFPQFVCDDYDAITVNETGGFLAASECLFALADRLKRLGGKLAEHVPVTGIDISTGRPQVRIGDNGSEVIAADRVVIAAGAWVNDLLPELKLPVRATRQQVCYFDVTGNPAFAVGAFPVFLADMRFYGFPDSGDGLFKVASHVVGNVVDPSAAYEVDHAEIDDCITFLRRVIPQAANGEAVRVNRCMYDMTPDEDFIIDRHPANDRVTIGSGFSGHGFKFGILTGRLIAALALGDEPEFPLDRFQLSRFYTP